MVIFGLPLRALLCFSLLQDAQDDEAPPAVAGARPPRLQ